MLAALPDKAARAQACSGQLDSGGTLVKLPYSQLLLGELIANFSQISTVAARVYGVWPDVWLTDEPGGRPNAYAEAPRGPGQRGDVYIGLRFYTESLRQLMLRQSTRPGAYNYGITSVYFHEFGHIVQSVAGQQSASTVVRELGADFLSGWGLGRIAAPIPSFASDVREATSQLFEWGDFEYNSPQHHGTQCQRAAMYRRGLALGMRYPLGPFSPNGESISVALQASIKAVQDVLASGPMCGAPEGN